MGKKAIFSISLSLSLHIAFLGLLLFWHGKSPPMPLGVSLEVLPFVGEGRSPAPAVRSERAGPSHGAERGPIGVVGGEAVVAKERYLFELRLYLDRNKKYPARARALGQAGKVLVRFSVLGDGSFTDVRLLGECPYESLNREASALFQRLGRFHPLPAEIGVSRLEIELPIMFSLDR